jgi:CBS domain-containing protein
MALHDPITPAVKQTPIVGLDDSLLAAAREMTKHDVSALIVKQGDELIGILTDMDIMEGIVHNGSDLSETNVAS